MNDWNDEPSRASIQKIITRLREPIHLDETFDVRVMSAVHAQALAQCDAKLAEHRKTDKGRQGWWHRTYTLELSAIGAMALAASIIGIAFIGATMLSRAPRAVEVQHAAAAPAEIAPAPTQNVHFILVDGSAKQVWLVGDFNGWSKKETPLVRAANGSAWTVAVPLSQGRHEYAFIVNDDSGERWVADPLTRVHEDEFGTVSSMVSVEPSAATTQM